MKLVIGLGNPGEKYRTTRHNVGFLALDHYLADKNPIQCASKFEAEICELHFGDTKVYFVKPQTFMNLSGTAVREMAQFYKADPGQDLLIVHDEVDLPFGTVRVTADSSAAGHNGVQNIFDELGTQAIRRIRIGVEQRVSRLDMPTDAFVLQNFSAGELEQLPQKVFPEVNQHIDQFIQN